MQQYSTIPDTIPRGHQKANASNKKNQSTLRSQMISWDAPTTKNLGYFLFRFRPTKEEEQQRVVIMSFWLHDSFFCLNQNHNIIDAINTSC